MSEPAAGSYAASSLRTGYHAYRVATRSLDKAFFTMEFTFRGDVDTSRLDAAVAHTIHEVEALAEWPDLRPRPNPGDQPMPPPPGRRPRELCDPPHEGRRPPAYNRSPPRGRRRSDSRHLPPHRPSLRQSRACSRAGEPADVPAARGAGPAGGRSRRLGLRILGEAVVPGRRGTASFGCPADGRTVPARRGGDQARPAPGHPARETRPPAAAPHRSEHRRCAPGAGRTARVRGGPAGPAGCRRL